MTQQTDWIKEREAIRARLEAATPGDWHNEGDFLADENTVVVGDESYNWRMVAHCNSDTDEQDDRGVPETPQIGAEQARANAELVAHAPEDLRRLLAKSEEDEREIASLCIYLKRAYERAQMLSIKGARQSDEREIEMLNSIAEANIETAKQRCAENLQLTAELALREQRIEEIIGKDAAQMMQEVCDQRDAAQQRINEAESEVRGVLDSVPSEFRIVSRPSAGAENIYESLAISVAKMSAELAALRRANEEGNVVALLLRLIQTGYGFRVIWSHNKWTIQIAAHSFTDESLVTALEAARQSRENEGK